MKHKENKSPQGTEKEFLDMFQQLCYGRSSWQVWGDLITAIACSISNVTDRIPVHWEKREEEYVECAKRLGSDEVVAEILAIIVMALEKNPEQDFLGKMYMDLNLGDHWKGQFFTPYNVCKMMSQMTVGQLDAQIEQHGFVSVCDPSCGAGATLIAAANTGMKSKYNFQNHMLFVAQDIDRITGMMCYIQLSLLGCAGYVCIGNSLTNPMTGNVLFPNEMPGQELWYMPVFFSEVWTMRRMFKEMDRWKGGATPQKPVAEKEHYFIFDFTKKEIRYGEQHIGSEAL